MAKSGIDKNHMELIIDRIHEGCCVPFLGAGANVSSDDPRYRYIGLPLGAEVADRLCKALSLELKGWNRNDLARVALKVEFETDRPYLITNLKSIIPDYERKPSPLLSMLAELPFKLIITTNYDRLLEQALKLKKVSFKKIIQKTKGFSETKKSREWCESFEGYDGLILYKIHGSFLGKRRINDDIESRDSSPIIITEEDYIEFLTIVGKENIGIPRFILKKIIPSTLLFLGYSLEDWDFRTIYKGIIEPLPKHQVRKSFAIQKKPSKFWVEFWKKKGVEIYNIDLYDFADQLKLRYQEKYG